MNNFILDTNVLVVANGNAPQMCDDDINICEEFIISLYNNSLIFIDSEYLIFEEYFKNINRSGQPGLGDAFAKWLFDNQYNKNVCEIVIITPLDNEGTLFLEFDLEGDLINFDRSDRKFIAVAIASSNIPEICNASDSDWWDFKELLNSLGIKIKFICPHQLSIWETNL